MTIDHLLGRLSAITDALGVETTHLAGEDEDAHARLGKLIGLLDSTVKSLIEASNGPGE